MPSLPEIAIVGVHEKSMLMLQRRVGGILKGIANVSICTPEKAESSRASVFICYSHGYRLALMKEKYKNKKIILGVELAILPAGIRAIQTLPLYKKLGIVAEHRRCANWFFVEVVRSGISDNPVIIGTFEEMPVMQVDAFVVPEELADLIPKGVPADKVILVPRTISPWSAAEIISAALKVGNEHWQGKPSDYLS